MIVFAHKSRIKNAASLFTLIFLVALSLGAQAKSRNDSRKRILAFYYTWYGTKETSGAWVHWDAGGHHPDSKSLSGTPDIGATDHPLALYDSNDPGAIRRHLEEARQAGIDGFVATWWGRGDWTDAAFRKVLTEAEAEMKSSPHPVRLSIYYERTPADASDPVSAVVADFEYLLTHYGGSPAFYCYKGAPVLFVYGRAVGELSRDQWKAVLKRVRAKNRVFVVGDGEDPALYSVFDALHTYNPVGEILDGTDMRARYRQLARQAKAAHRLSTATILPGYDDSHIGRAKSIVAPREKGRLSLRLWNDALDASPDWILIATYNEWHEGTEIEPSVEYGDQFLRQTARFSQFFKSGQTALVDAPRSRDSGRWKIEPDGGSRIAYRALPGGGMSIENLSGGTGALRLSAPDGKEPYLFQVGREGRLWRVLPPLDLKGKEKLSAYRYALPFDAEAQAWTSADFAKAHPESPFAEMAKWDLHLDLSSLWADDDANWRAYPDGPFPIYATLRNDGAETLKEGKTEIVSPEGWGKSEATLSRPLPPGGAETFLLSSRPDSSAPVGKADPIFVWMSLKTEDGKPIRFQNNFDVRIRPPLKVAFTFGESGTLTAHLENQFPGHRLYGEAALRVSEGRVSETNPIPFALDATAEIEMKQRSPDHEAPRLRRTYATFAFGAYRQTASVLDAVTLDLGAKSDDQGLQRVDVADGVVERVVIPASSGNSATEKGIPALRAVLSPPGRNHYVYFDVSDSFPASGSIRIHVDYLDQGTGSIMLQYDSTDPKATLDGRYKDAEKIALTNSDLWKSCEWKIDDARFANRQNGGADFRLEMGPEPVVFRRVTVSKWPIR